MTTVVLVNPGRDKLWASILPPINLGYIASYLEKYGVEVHIVDELAGQDVEKAFERLQPEIVGITATTALAPDAYRIAEIAREFNAVTVMGGVHATTLPEEALQHVDIVVRGEGERAMLEVVNGNRSRIIKSPYIENLDDIPPPAWHLMDMEFYLSSVERLPKTHLGFLSPETRVGCVMSSRGCPFSCIFCCNSWRDTPVRFHSAEWVVSSIEFLVDHYNIQALYFADDDLFVNKKRLTEICQLMIERELNLIWSCQARADTVDLESLKMAKAAGCRQVQFGFESGSERILDILKNKTTTVEQNAQAVNLCKQAGIICFATFMIGNPTETIEDVMKTFQFIRNNDIDRVGVLITTPFPGTRLWEWCKEHNLIPEKFDWSEFMTDRVAIPACDTMSAETIMHLKQEITNYLYPHPLPILLWEFLREIRSEPLLLFNPNRYPINALTLMRALFKTIHSSCEKVGVKHDESSFNQSQKNTNLRFRSSRI